jgi:vanadium-dependent haloperoxidase-like protein/uncharacterized protein DUF6851
VVQWSYALLQAVTNTRFAPTLTARALAITHTCIYDAWAAYDPVAVGVYWQTDLRQPPRDQPQARAEAISFAAHTALIDLFLPSGRYSIAVWDCKRRYDSERPVTAIHYLYDGKPVRAWAGPGLGTRLIDGRQFRSYIGTPPFAEYVSGHSTFSAAGGGAGLASSSPDPPASSNNAKRKRMTCRVTALPYTGTISEVPCRNQRLLARPGVRRFFSPARCARRSRRQ